MTGRIEAIRMRTALAGLALALLGAAMLFISPSGTALADTNRQKCAYNGAVSVLGATTNQGLVSDCAALLKAKKTLQGSGGRELNWSGKVPIGQWDGVTLGGSPPRVTQLWLDGRDSSGKLKGKIPKQLGNLSELTYLVLYYNELSGTIPKQLGNLPNLRYLELNSNNLTGRIPPQLGNLSNLEGVNLGGNRLTGKIPKQLGKLSNLRTLILYHNQLSGQIPKSLGKLSSLRRLLIRTNRLTGEIPKELGELPELRVLELYLNNLTGCVPASLKDIDYFGHTTMYGPIEGLSGWTHNGVAYVKLPWCSD